MLIQQFRTGLLKNFSYLVACEKTRLALVVDPPREVRKITQAAQEKGLAIVYGFCTHDHFDHTDGNARLKKMTGAKIIMHRPDADHNREADIRLNAGSTLRLGEILFQVIHTPGHSPGGACLYAEGNLFTGDTLFVGDSGMTDLSGGDRAALGRSIREKLMTLPEDTIVWPGHDLGSMPHSTIGWEKRNNVNAREYGYFVQDSQ